MLRLSDAWRLPVLCLMLAGMAACSSDAPPATATAHDAPPLETGATAAVDPSWRPISEVNPGIGSSNCHIDSLAGAANVTTARLQKGGVLAVSGWVAIEEGSAVPSEAWVRIEDGANGRVWEVPVNTFTPRPDVAEATGQPGLMNSGFTVAINTAELPADAKHVYLAYRHENKDYFCDGGHQVILD